MLNICMAKKETLPNKTPHAVKITEERWGHGKTLLSPLQEASGLPSLPACARALCAALWQK